MYDKQLFLTSLAGAVFPRDCLVDKSSDLGYDVMKTSDIINACCQSGGFYIDYSDVNCALVAACVATKNMSVKTEANKILVKTAKQYTNRGKEYDANRFAIFIMYASGGSGKRCGTTDFGGLALVYALKNIGYFLQILDIF